MSGVRRVALTGGIASGKSYCRRRFEALGVPTLDADQLAREAVAPGTPGLRAVAARFGAHLVRRDGHLDRAALAGVIFHDPAARRDLEAIVHPFVYEAITAWFDGLRRVEGGVALADVPLLFETGHEGDFDRVVVASCPPEMQVARLCERDGLPEAEAHARLASQMPIEDKARRADFVIDTSGTFEATDAAVAAVLTDLRAGR
ncbi:MAG: dephospho-CoA kinase [Vicinamibacterales bacterium]